MVLFLCRKNIFDVCSSHILKGLGKDHIGVGGLLGLIREMAESRQRTGSTSSSAGCHVSVDLCWWDTAVTLCIPIKMGELMITKRFNIVIIKVHIIFGHCEASLLPLVLKAFQVSLVL